MKNQITVHTRTVLQTFLIGGSKIESHWLIELRLGLKWVPVGDETGLLKFTTKEAADEALSRLVLKLSAQPPTISHKTE